MLVTTKVSQLRPHKKLKILKIFGISILSIFNVCVIYLHRFTVS